VNSVWKGTLRRGNSPKSAGAYVSRHNVITKNHQNIPKVIYTGEMLCSIEVLKDLECTATNHVLYKEKSRGRIAEAPPPQYRKRLFIRAVLHWVTE
jgi:hypothetical protein